MLYVHKYIQYKTDGDIMQYRVWFDRLCNFDILFLVWVKLVLRICRAARTKCAAYTQLKSGDKSLCKYVYAHRARIVYSCALLQSPFFLNPKPSH